MPITSRSKMCPPLHRFQKIETLPGLPEEETARKILETLADDPGIRAVLEKHQWTVGALCELYPEGKVRISVFELTPVISPSKLRQGCII